MAHQSNRTWAVQPPQPQNKEQDPRQSGSSNVPIRSILWTATALSSTAFCSLSFGPGQALPALPSGGPMQNDTF